MHLSRVLPGQLRINRVFKLLWPQWWDSHQTFFPFLLAIWLNPPRAGWLTPIRIITAETISLLAQGDTLCAFSKNTSPLKAGGREEKRALKSNYGRHGIDNSFVLLVPAESKTLCSSNECDSLSLSSFSTSFSWAYQSARVDLVESNSLFALWKFSVYKFLSTGNCRRALVEFVWFDHSVVSSGPAAK